jgi:thiol-disulfide isomerase/thioredoxin
MKQYLISIFFIFFALSLFGQDEYLNNKIENANLKQIKNKILVDYNLLEQTKGKVTIIEFWETWCGPCIEAMHHLKKLKEKFPDKLEIVCVSCDDLEKTISFIEKNKFPFNFVYDKEKYLKGQVFPHSGIPHSILVDKTGKIQAGTLPGFMTEEVINN